MLVSFVKIFSLIFIQGICNNYISCLLFPILYLFFINQKDYFILLVLSFIYEIIFTNHYFIFIFIIFLLIKLKKIFYKFFRQQLFIDLCFFTLSIIVYSLLMYIYLSIINNQTFDVMCFLKIGSKHIIVNLYVLIIILLIQAIFKCKHHIFKW